jgi:hypothetical protein
MSVLSHRELAVVDLDIQILFDNARNTLAGFNFAPAAGIIWLLRQLVNNVIVRADDVATWPNVRYLTLHSGEDL